MPHYYFHLHNSEFVRDEEGTDYCSDEAARQQAVTSLRSIASGEVMRGYMPRHMTIDVHDAADKPLFTVALAEAVVPAA